MGLDPYRRKRDFGRTPEPQGRRVRRGGRRFVIQEHAARRHHFDFRLELGGVLKSWAVPRGPGRRPGEKRLAVHVEDHPLEYAEFEGTIPVGEYGAGEVIVWDEGRWFPEDDPDESYRRGRLHFRLEGRKLTGTWTLARMGGRRDTASDQWLLIRGHDEDEPRPWDNRSVISGRTLGAARPAGERQSGRTVPTWIGPQLARAVTAPPRGDRWLHEIKLDGYRMAARIDSGSVTLLSRNHKDWTGRFPRLTGALAALPLRDAWLDGELAVLQPDGRTSFQALQNALEGPAAFDVVYFVFDLLHLDGNSVAEEPLRERKRRLADLLAAEPPGDSPLRYTDHIEGRGDAFFDQACAVGLEGIVSKDGDRPHVSGRSRDWLKVKCTKRQEFVVVGFTEPRGGRRGLGALLLGVHDGTRLRYAGRVGTGFDHDTLRRLRERLAPLERRSTPVTAGAAEARVGIHWVEPQLVAEVAFSDWTRSGLVRQASFQGLREDKSPRDVGVEKTEATPRRRPRTVRGKDSDALLDRLRLSNPDKVLYPEQGVTKRDLARYYRTVADRVLADIADRPLTLLRCPEGHHNECFFQKHANESVPAAVGRTMIKEKEGRHAYLYVADAEGLLGLVQMGALEIHPWGARRDRPERPDRMVFDLDPAPDVPWEAVIEAAAELHELLGGELGWRSFLRTTGGKGLHIVVPLARRQGWREVKDAARAVAHLMVKRAPRRYTARQSKARRTGRIYIDYLRNGMGATAVGNYTTRARAGAPVATPLRWDELGSLRSPAAYHIHNVPARMRALRRDPWEGFDGARQAVTRHVLKALGVE